MNISGLLWAASFSSLLCSHLLSVIPVYALASAQRSSSAHVPQQSKGFKAESIPSAMQDDYHSSYHYATYYSRGAAYQSGRSLRQLAPSKVAIPRATALWAKSIRRYVRASFPPVAVMEPRANLVTERTRHSKASLDSPLEKSSVTPLIDKQCIVWQQDAPVQSPPAPQRYQVWVEGYLVAEVPQQSDASLLSSQIVAALRSPEFDPETLEATWFGDRAVGRSANQVVFGVDESLAQALGRNQELIAIDWVNNLRTALDVEPIALTEAQIRMHQLEQTGELVEGTASWYGPYFHGRLTANGEIFDQDEFTAAHPSLPFNTYLKVTNLLNGHSIVVRINDRGPYVGSRSLDLSRKAARCLDSEYHGVVPYTAVIMKPSEEAIALSNSSSSAELKLLKPAKQEIASQP